MSKPDTSDDRFEQAAEWWERTRNGGPEEWAAFTSWLTSDPLNAEAYARIEAAWDGFEENQSAPNMLQLRSEVMGRVQRLQAAKSQSAYPNRRMVVSGLIAAGIAAVASLGFLFAPKWGRKAYETGVGQQQTILLSDGSRVTLDANTRLDVIYTAKERNIQLERGRALFEVAKNHNRPFNVRVTDRTVRAIGTAFTVERETNAMHVVLAEGRIRVSRSGRGSAKEQIYAELTPGQSVSVADAAGATPTYAAVDIDRDLAWRQSQLFFDQVPLENVVARVNNYSESKVGVTGRARRVLVSGMFIAGQSDAFVEAVQKVYPLKAISTSKGVQLDLR